MIAAGLLTATGAGFTPQTRVTIVDGKWQINGKITYPGTQLEGLLMNVRMVNATFEDLKKQNFDPATNTTRFITQIPAYVSQGVLAFTLSMQGGMPGYEGAVNSAYNPDGSLRTDYVARVSRVIEACDRRGVVVILGCLYQRQSRILRDEAAVRAAVVNTAIWIRDSNFKNVVLEVANEYPHKGFAHPIIRSAEGQASLIRLAKQTAPALLISASGYGDGKIHPEVAEASDFLLIHYNGVKEQNIAGHVAALKSFKKPIVCNEDDKKGQNAIEAMNQSIASGASYGLMLLEHNQHFPFHFDGAADDPAYYDALKAVTSGKPVVPTAATRVTSEKKRPTARPAPEGAGSFPPPESRGGWHGVENAGEIEAVTGMDSAKVDALREWLLKSDTRNFAAVVIRKGRIVLEVERGNSAVNDTRNVKSCAKAICATVLAIASDESRLGHTPHKMSFDDPAFQFIPWAQPLSDPRKSQITVKQLLNHTSGITPESTGVRNSVHWEVIMGHADEPRTQKLTFDPGSDLDYGTHPLYHAALVCEYVTGQSYDQYAIEHLLKPLGIEKWWFEFLDGDAKHGRHASHAIGLPARELARIAFCMLHNGRWGDRQVVPEWFVRETAAPTHAVSGIKTFGRDARSFSHGWELPGLLGGDRGKGIPRDARFKPGSGGQLIAFVPSLDLVITRQTGASGQWEYEEYLRRACDAVLKP